MTARKVSVASQLYHPHEARAPAVVVMDQQATECRRRRVDHEVGERKPALISDGGIYLALQTLDNFLQHMIRRLYGLDNADKQKNITSTTCCIQRIQIQSYTSTCQRPKHADTLCVLVAWYPTAKQQPKSHDNSEIKSKHLRCTAWGSSCTPAATS